MNKLLNLLTPPELMIVAAHKNGFMQEDPQDGRTRSYILMRTLMDVGMGIIYIAVALFIIFAKKFGFEGAVFDPPFSYIFAGICIAYGSFRIYRGVKKNYFRS
jgi:hypothetical protein